MATETATATPVKAGEKYDFKGLAKKIGKLLKAGKSWQEVVDTLNADRVPLYPKSKRTSWNVRAAYHVLYVGTGGPPGRQRPAPTKATPAPTSGKRTTSPDPKDKAAAAGA
jgi:hypothetical protein